MFLRCVCPEPVLANDRVSTRRKQRHAVVNKERRVTSFRTSKAACENGSSLFLSALGTKHVCPEPVLVK
jgi:hypothetical protein